MIFLKSGVNIQTKNTTHVWNLAILTPSKSSRHDLSFISPCSISKRPSNSDRNSTPSLLTSKASKSPWISRASREAPQKMSDLGEMLGIFVEQSGTYDICPTFFLAFILYLGEILWNNRSSVSTTSSMIHHNISWFLHLTSHLLPGKPPCHQATPGLKFNLAVLTGQLAGLAWWVQPKLYHFPM